MIITLAHQSIKFSGSCFVLACETGAEQIWMLFEHRLSQCLFPTLGQFSVEKTTSTNSYTYTVDLETGMMGVFCAW